MRIDEARKNYFARAIDLENLLAMLPDPRIAESIFRRPYRNDLPSDAQRRSVFDDPQFFQFGATARAGPGRMGSGESEVGQCWPAAGEAAFSY